MSTAYATPAVRALSAAHYLCAYASSPRLSNLIGPRWAAVRQKGLELMTGKRPSLSQSGINRFEAELLRLSGLDRLQLCKAEQYDLLNEWVFAAGKTGQPPRELRTGAGRIYKRDAKGWRFSHEEEEPAYVVVDDAFNRANAPELIGKRVAVPPSYTHVCLISHA